MSPGFAALESPWSGARKDDELLGRVGHRDIAVDRSFDACSDDAGSKRLWVDEDDDRTPVFLRSGAVASGVTLHVAAKMMA
jgi:hypothetical protein